jgi:hypothetical protein
MALEITGKLIKILPQQTGTGAKGGWAKQEFIIETTDQYPKKVCLSAWGEKVNDLEAFKPNDSIKVSFNLESREYNEKWYTDIRAWKIEKAGDAQAPTKKEPATISSQASSEDDDLPF